jgi:hypothetical protein
MVRTASGVDYAADLTKIRESYISATPRQRLLIIRQRLEDHHFGLNRLVTLELVAGSVDLLAQRRVRSASSRKATATTAGGVTLPTPARET